MNDTIAALSTPQGESAIALVRLSGADCEKIAQEIFSKKSITPRQANFGAYKNLDDEKIDECVFTLFKGPASYTGEDMLEISCHGNPFIVQKILEDLFARGVRGAHAGEFTRRAFINDKLDLSQAEAVALVIGARSQRSLQAAQKQLSGELGKRIAEFSDRLMDMTALVEAYIDFPEDDLPDEDKQALFKSADELASDFSRLIETSKYTHLVHNGINAVIAGAPNAGKSSLLNRLVGDERAIVSSSAGTTRDFISEKIILGKYSLNIVDTAGLRTPDGEIEARGIGMAIDKLKLSDIRLLVFDSADEPPELPEEVIATLSPDNTIAIINKCDLPDAKIALFKEKFKDFNPVEISCEKSQGIENLRNAIINLIETKHITASADDILVSARHASALERAKDALKSASMKIEANEASELPASDLREALNALGEIVGKTDHEQILDRIFSKFCIGK
ncbi:MAG: tRNA uridine-5-carboxymethylaminomethyl(34) synthesis GTPase MnmE [Opitutales bacterium]|nr:tRNA uridine-5-carboxymethylaminomethyl(34) synthesis GTPase MnmE [Opitutales bacterium]